MTTISDERLAEIEVWAANEEAQCRDEDMPVSASFYEDVVSMTKSLRAQGGVMAEYWDVQEYKVWKGIDPEKPVWASRGFCCPRWEGANELLEYLQRNDQSLILRVAPLSSLEASPAPVSEEMTLDDEELDTILAIGRNEQSGRVTNYELKELVRVYRAALAAKGGQ